MPYAFCPGQSQMNPDPTHPRPAPARQGHALASLAVAVTVAVGGAFAPLARAQGAPASGAQGAASAATPASAPIVARYAVRPGQSLSDIAGDIGKTTDKNMRERVASALFKANPQAFSNGDRNKLRLGATLNVPDVSGLLAMPAPTQAASASGPGPAARGVAVPSPVAPASANVAPDAVAAASRPGQVAPGVAGNPQAGAQVAAGAIAGPAGRAAGGSIDAAPSLRATAPAVSASSGSSVIGSIAPAAPASAVVTPAPLTVAPVSAPAAASSTVSIPVAPAAASPASTPAAQARAGGSLATLVALALLFAAGAFFWLRRRSARPAAPAAAPAPTGLDAPGAADTLVELGGADRAERLLRSQLERTPDDPELIGALLELYANRGEIEAFGELAAALWDLTDGSDAHWARAAELGRRIDPDNPLYGQDLYSQPTSPPAPVNVPAGARRAFESVDLSLPELPELPPETASATAGTHAAAARAEAGLPADPRAPRDGENLPAGALRTGPPAAYLPPGTDAAAPPPIPAIVASHAAGAAPRTAMPGAPQAPFVAEPVSVEPADEPVDRMLAGTAAAPALAEPHHPVAEAPHDMRVALADDAPRGPVAVTGMGAAGYGGLSLDLPGQGAGSTAPTPRPGAEEVAVIARNKLALAAEYIELGDISGARMLAGEVIDSNDQGTREQARRLLATLAPLS
jgi:pilus assembly protein FimV